MQTTTIYASKTSPFNASRPFCPACKDYLMRIPRRFIDRIFSQVFPVQRYRCQHFTCQWEGNIRVLNVKVITKN
jgi:hypothetical protein